MALIQNMDIRSPRAEDYNLSQDVLQQKLNEHGLRQNGSYSQQLVRLCAPRYYDLCDASSVRFSEGVFDGVDIYMCRLHDEKEEWIIYFAHDRLITANPALYYIHDQHHLDLLQQCTTTNEKK